MALGDPYLVYYDANPWKTRHRNDCAIRSVKAAIGMRYAAVCEAFGRECARGTGLVGNAGINLDLIKKRFDNFFDVVEDAKDSAWENRPEEFDDMEFDPLIDGENVMGMTLDDFCDIYGGQGRFLVSMQANPDAEYSAVRNLKGGHIVYADLRKDDDPKYYDTWNCGECLVKAFMRVRGILKKTDPRSVYFKKS